MNVYRESEIEFDFTNANAVVRPDREPFGGVWPNVDFRVDEGSRELWIEVKSWHPSRFKTVAERIDVQKEFAGKIGSEEFGRRIIAKFLGTTAYLAWTGAFAPKPIVYVVLLDSVHPRRSALLLSFKDRLRPRFPKTHPWSHPITHVVMDLETFKATYARYPCARV